MRCVRFPAEIPCTFGWAAGRTPMKMQWSCQWPNDRTVAAMWSDRGPGAAKPDPCVCGADARRSRKSGGADPARGGSVRRPGRRERAVAAAWPDARARSHDPAGRPSREIQPGDPAGRPGTSTHKRSDAARRGRRAASSHSWCGSRRGGESVRAPGGAEHAVSRGAGPLGGPSGAMRCDSFPCGHPIPLHIRMGRRADTNDRAMAVPVDRVGDRDRFVCEHANKGLPRAAFSCASVCPAAGRHAGRRSRTVADRRLACWPDPPGRPETGSGGRSPGAPRIRGPSATKVNDAAGVGRRPRRVPGRSWWLGAEWF